MKKWVHLSSNILGDLKYRFPIVGSAKYPECQKIGQNCKVVEIRRDSHPGSKGRPYFLDATFNYLTQ